MRIVLLLAAPFLILPGCHRCEKQQAQATVIQQPVDAQPDSTPVMANQVVMPQYGMVHQQQQMMMMPQQQPSATAAIGLGIFRVPLPVPKLYAVPTGPQQPIILPTGPIVNPTGPIVTSGNNEQMTQLLLELLKQKQGKPNPQTSVTADQQKKMDDLTKSLESMESMLIELEEIE